MKNRKKNEAEEKLQPIDEHWQVFQPPERCDNFFRGPQLYDRGGATVHMFTRNTWFVNGHCHGGCCGLQWSCPPVMLVRVAVAVLVAVVAAAAVGRGTIIVTIAAPAMTVQNYY